MFLKWCATLLVSLPLFVFPSTNLFFDFDPIKNNQFLINDINNLKNNSKFKIPQNIYIVASNNLSKLQISFYSKLSEITNVNIYLLSPGNDLWNRINIEDGAISLDDFNEKKYLLNESIESIFCKFIANYEKLIEETTINEEIKVNIQLPFIDPTINLKKNHLNIY